MSLKTQYNDKEIKGPDGFTYPSQAALARAYGISPIAFRSRLNTGWDIEKALTTPVKSHGAVGPDGKKYRTLRSLLFDYGISVNRYSYLHSTLGLPLDEILKMGSFYLAKDAKAYRREKKK